MLAVLSIGCTQALAKVVDDHSNTHLSNYVRVIENQSVMDAAHLQSTRAHPACHVFRHGAAAFNALGTPAVLWNLPCGMLNVDAAPHQCYEQHKIPTSALLQMQHAMDPYLKPARLHPYHKLLRKMPKTSCPAFKVHHSACCGCSSCKQHTRRMKRQEQDVLYRKPMHASHFGKTISFGAVVAVVFIVVVSVVQCDAARKAKGALGGVTHYAYFDGGCGFHFVQKDRVSDFLAYVETLFDRLSDHGANLGVMFELMVANEDTTDIWPPIRAGKELITADPPPPLTSGQSAP